MKSVNCYHITTLDDFFRNILIIKFTVICQDNDSNKKHSVSDLTSVRKLDILVLSTLYMSNTRTVIYWYKTVLQVFNTA